jgi:uncharacterized Zn finger protein
MAKKRYTNYYDDYYAHSLPIDAEGGIKARDPRSSGSHTWWSQRWLKHMESQTQAGRLQRGRSYARKGQVLSLEEKPGSITARVQGSRVTPYKVVFQISPLSSAQWDKAIDVMAQQAIFAAQLLAGEMPETIEEAFGAAGVELFPDRSRDLAASCSCPDPAGMCKHIAAVHYLLADRFDEDPFLLFRLRGRSQDQIVQALRQKRSGELAVEVDLGISPVFILPLDQALDHFWELAAPLEPFPLSIKPPAIEAPLLRRLGEPNFLPGLSLQGLLTPVYQAITRAAMVAAFSEDEPAED